MSNTLDKSLIRKGALGKGIGSLLGSNSLSDNSEENTAKQIPSIHLDNSSMVQGSALRANMVVQIRVDQIRVNPKQPRKYFDEQKLQELSVSIRRDGIIQPLVVIKDGMVDGHFTLIAGERRLRAAKLSGLTQVPAIIKDFAPEDHLRVALIENIQRADLNVIEEAEALSSLIKELGLTQEQCAQQVGKDRSTITNLLRLLQLPDEVQSDLMSGNLSAGHARCLLSLEDKQLMLRARDIILKKSLSVRQSEHLCKNVKKLGDSEGQGLDLVNDKEIDPNLEYLAEKVRSAFRTKVRIVGTPARGRIELSYFNAAELERIIHIMESSSRSI